MKNLRFNLYKYLSGDDNIFRNWYWEVWGQDPGFTKWISDNVRNRVYLELPKTSLIWELPAYMHGRYGI